MILLKRNFGELLAFGLAILFVYGIALAVALHSDEAGEYQIKRVELIGQCRLSPGVDCH
jgi:hypothetical protein